MIRIKLNKSEIEKHVATPKVNDNGKPTVVFYRDTELTGFALRVTSNGVKSFIVEKKFKGKAIRSTIGKYGQLTPDQARKQAIIFLGKIATGLNPVEERKKTATQNMSLLQLLKAYLQYKGDKLKERTIDDYKKILAKELLSLSNTKIDSITRAKVKKLFKELTQTSPSRANYAMRVLKLLFNHVINEYFDENDEPIIRYNPASTIKMNQIDRRQTILEESNLDKWFSGVNQVNSHTGSDYLVFVLLTGLRKTECLKLRWENVNFSDKTFTVFDTKNGRPLSLPMSDYLNLILVKRRALTHGDWVFTGIDNTSRYKEPRGSLKSVTRISNIKFCLHDLRRTFMTTADSLDISLTTIKRLANHKSNGDVTEGYIIRNIERLRKPIQMITDHLLSKGSIDKYDSTPPYSGGV